MQITDIFMMLPLCLYVSAAHKSYYSGVRKWTRFRYAFTPFAALWPCCPEYLPQIGRTQPKHVSCWLFYAHKRITGTSHLFLLRYNVVAFIVNWILYVFSTGQEDWGGQCVQGRRQSPVDLSEEASILGLYPTLMFTNYSEPMVLGKVRNTGHSRKLKYLCIQFPSIIEFNNLSWNPIFDFRFSANWCCRRSIVYYVRRWFARNFHYGPNAFSLGFRAHH